MPIESSYLFAAAMDVESPKEELFNEVYDHEHIPFLTEVPGVLSVARFRTEELTMAIGGQRRTVKVEDQPKYTALYELESPSVLTSDAWAKAVERGRWSEQVRPYTANRRHVLMRRVYPG